MEMSPARPFSLDSRRRGRGWLRLGSARFPGDNGFFAAHVVLPIVVGATIYVLWRSTALRVFTWLALGGLAAPVARLRELAAPLGSALPDWFLYSLPDGLWVYAVMSFMARVWREDARRRRVLWIAAGPLLGVGWEMAQRAGIAPGTFDGVDLLWYAVATAAASCLHRPWAARPARVGA